jgi:hypothetical protein
LSVTPERVSRAKTAAASVEPTMAPSSKAVRQSRPTNQTAATAVMPAQTTTPTVASSEAGRSPVRKVAYAVRNPPSSRITASARLPTQKLSLKSSNRYPPMPSSPARMPARRKISRKERPIRAENRLVSTLANTSAEAASKGKLTNSMRGVSAAGI